MPGDSNNHNSDNHKKDSQEHANPIADAAHYGAEVTEAGEKAAHAVGNHLPKATGAVQKIAKTIAEAMHDDPKYGIAENLACGAAKMVAANVAAAPIVKAAAKQGMDSIPGKNPYAKLGGALCGALMVQPVVDEATKPLKALVGQKCHAFFDHFRYRAREQAMNPFPPPMLPARFLPAPTPYEAHQSRSSSLFLETLALNQFRSDPRYQLLDHFQKQAAERSITDACALSNHYGLSSLHDTLSLYGLSRTYNSYNADSIVREAFRHIGEMGGVATKVALIEDVVDSETHASAKDYIFCFPLKYTSLSSKAIQTIIQEIEQAARIYGTSPLFSLHFNKKGILSPVIHEAFKDTLTGSVIAFLDYWMKGFANGGTFLIRLFKRMV